MTMSIVSERRDRAPFGLNGAGSGKPGRNILIRGEETRELPGKTSVEVQAGDVLCLKTPGGGGYNPTPEQREEMLRL